MIMGMISYQLWKKSTGQRCQFSHEELVGADVTKQDDGGHHTQNLQGERNNVINNQSIKESLQVDIIFIHRQQSKPL